MSAAFGELFTDHGLLALAVVGRVEVGLERAEDLSSVLARGRDVDIVFSRDSDLQVDGNLPPGSISFEFTLEC